MTTSVKFVENDAGIVALLHSPGVVAQLMARGEKVAAQAQATAPVGSSDEGDKHPGQYRDSITVTAMSGSGRAWVKIGSDLPYATKLCADTGNLAAALDAGAG